MIDTYQPSVIDRGICHTNIKNEIRLKTVYTKNTASTINYSLL